MKKTSFLLSIILLMQFLVLPICEAANVGGKEITSQDACVMDFETGEILYEYNGDVPRVPASMTKIMNLYLVYEALQNGEISLDTVVPISKNVYNKSRNSVYQSVLPLYYDTTYTVDEMIGVIVTYSASGAAVAMAELLGDGSEENFVAKMNAKAKEMGIDATYYDSCGIAENKVSPIAMATLARNIIKDYPDILVRSAKKSVRFHGNTYKTTNHLLDTYYYEGADGLKTGTTGAAGYCFCGTAVRGGRRMISVTMRSSSTGQRFIDTARLLDYGFSVANAKYGSIYYTNTKTYINGASVPTYFYKGSEPHAVVVAEDLSNYGFDVSWNETTKTLTLTANKEKKITPISQDTYKGKDGEKAYTIVDNNDIKVVLDNGIQTHELKDVYNVGGYMCVSIDELADIYAFTWNEQENAAYIKTAPKAILPNGEVLTSGSAFVMDFETGETLYEFDADTQKAVASIAKMMSVYVLLDAVKTGEVTLDTIVPISENVYTLSRNENYKMMVNLEYDEVYTLDEMIDMIVIDSAAACVTAAAEMLCGSEEAFVKRMNEKAKEIGIDSVFYNGTGVCLNPETDKENLMSAREVAIMTRKMIEDYPEILERTKCASVEFHGKTYFNLNKMFTDYYYEGADGFKNGMTDASGYCMCGTAERSGKRVITVTLPSNSNEARFTDTAKLFDYGFSALGVSMDGAEEENAPVYTENMDIKVNIDGNYEMDFHGQSPVVMNNRVLIPVRELLETLEKTVSWNGESKTVTISDEVTTLTLTIGEKTMVKKTVNPIDGTVHTEQIELEAAPMIIGEKTCLPIRSVVEAFGAAVIWEAETETIFIIAGVC